MISRIQERSEIIILLDMMHRLNCILVHLPLDFDVEVRADIEYGICNIIQQIHEYERNERNEIPLR